MKLINSRVVLTLIVIFLLSSTVSFAQHSILQTKDSDLLRIDGIYAPNSNNQIKIGGQLRSMKSNQQNRIFSSKDKIDTAALKTKNGDGGYIEYTNLRTRQGQLRICWGDFVSTKTSTIHDFIVNKKSAGTKGRGNKIQEYGDFIGRYPWYMIEDTLYIPTNLTLDDNHGFSMELLFSNIELMGVPADITTGELVITKDFIEKDSIGNDTGIKLESGQEYGFVLNYWYRNKKTEITKSFFIRYIPKIK